MKLYAFFIRRLIFAIGVLLGVSLFVFMITRSIGDPITPYVTPRTPKDTIDLIRAKYHLNEPIYIQFAYWLAGILHGDLGLSPTYGYAPVSKLLVQYLPITVELALYTVLFSIPLGLWLGTKSAKNKDKVPDHLSRIFSIAGWSMPQFVIGLLLLYVLYLEGLIVLSPKFTFPTVTGMPTIDALLAGDMNGFIQAWQYLIGPLVVQVWTNVAIMARVLRSSLIEELGKDYVTTARAKGVKESVVVIGHARRNALISFITIAGVSAGYWLSGSVIVETVFNRLGVGLLAATAATHFDSALVLGFTLLAGVVMVGANFVADLMYAYFDPRIRLGE
jgi:ABC-type dipeptide/oligopeptide/nickel transport system permease component